MIILRVIGVLLILAALVILAREGLGWYQTGGWTVIPAGQLWFELDKNSLLLLQPALERHGAPFLWNPVMTTFLQWPAWAVLGVPGLALLLAGRRRPRRRFQSRS